MKILLAKCVEADCDDDGSVGQISRVLTGEGMTVDVMSLPPMAGSVDVLRTIASYRSLPLFRMADKVLALDVHACVLRHPVKLAWLSKPEVLPVATESGFLANLYSAGLRETTAVYASKAVAKQLQSLALKQIREFDRVRTSVDRANAKQTEYRWDVMVQALRA